MAALELLASSMLALAISCLLLGLVVGSFLNVVIYRQPLMMFASWRCQCRELLDLPEESDNKPFNLACPASHCPHCQRPIAWHENIPLISYVLLRGRCACGKAKISIRYPLVELLAGVAALLCALHFGYGAALLAALAFSFLLIALSGIDFDHQLLPDSMTLPGLWLGLLCNLFGLFTDLHSAVIGAMAGYLSLWSVYWLFRLLTGREGMGFGDFKLLAMLGAWLGWQALPQVILLSSLVGAIIGILLVVLGRQQRSQPLPFGPFLAAAGWLALLWGEQIERAYLGLLL